MIKQGDVYWLDLGEPDGSGPGYRRPCVVVQNDVFNASRLRTVVVAFITSNLKRAEAPGNVTLKKGEGKLPKQCVVNITQLYTVDEDELTEYLGHLGKKRVAAIADGIRLLIGPRE